MAEIRVTNDAVRGKSPALVAALSSQERRLDACRMADDEAACMVEILRGVAGIVDGATDGEALREELDGHRERVLDGVDDPQMRERLQRFHECEVRRRMTERRVDGVLRERGERVERLAADLDHLADRAAAVDGAAADRELSLIAKRLDAAAAWLRPGEGEALAESVRSEIVVRRARRLIESGVDACSEGVCLDGVAPARVEEVRRVALRGRVRRVMERLSRECVGPDGRTDWDVAGSRLVTDEGRAELDVDVEVATLATAECRIRAAMEQSDQAARREGERCAALDGIFSAHGKGDAAALMAALGEAEGLFLADERECVARALATAVWTTRPGALCEGAMAALTGAVGVSDVRVRIGVDYAPDDAERVAKLVSRRGEAWVPLLRRAVERVGAAFAGDDVGRFCADCALRDLLCRLEALGGDVALLDALTPGSGTCVVERIVAAYGGALDAAMPIV
ncbi:hypothetical protein GGQ74_002207 [Desulfobaculum xiamenense]|uniref:Uncharacterized protein n=1 Tax=Desulfobaculum xiamenense TaxID=995050 RepID=A0A846QTN4_9BACT|nr:hypothetical protein [Desulfobaculum xiamenense]NJB68534.1 hypothetical protein [Desulfobaculum xiamenense]